MQVVVRMRPLLPSEAGAPRVRLNVDEAAGQLAMTHMRRDYSFSVDGILGDAAGQQECVSVVCEFAIGRTRRLNLTLKCAPPFPGCTTPPGCAPS